jgi:hypothetical protein
VKRTAALLLLTPMWLAGQADTALYPTSVLARSYAMTPAQLDSEQTKFLAWLDSNMGRIDPRQGQALREHLYLIIGNRARLDFAAHGTVRPSAPDTTLARLFDWGARMGLTGADVVGDSLAAGTTMQIHRGMVPDSELTLTYTPPYYTIGAPHMGWSIRLPYYFMVSAVQHRKSNFGVETDDVFLSTLFGADSSGFHPPTSADHSQATIVLLSASHADSAAFVQFWFNAMGLSFANQSSESLLSGTTHLVAPANAQHILRECVMVSIPRGVLLITYLGLPGTFEDNRPHFLALLRTLTRS